uniref:E3 ubiquitin/ISG15 ligase TRIM25-like n=1 Tax=Cyprinus carpio TaxID=7962 RepID=A0A8C2CT24_CYPCA
MEFSQDELSCTVCLDLLKDPVTIQCGHNYCKSCITGFWDQEDQMNVYSCPQCRQTFSPRPALARNTMLAELVEGKRHSLIEATGRLQEMICQKHEKLLEVFCRTDQKWICMLCKMDEHKNHDTVSAIHYHLCVLQKQLKETQKTFQQRIHQREKDLQQLRESVESHKVSLEKKRSLSPSQFRLTEAESLCVLTALCTDSSGGQ